MTTAIRLFGTETSPYVRRVRILAHELELACDLVDTSTDAGQAELRSRTPIWKVPTAELDGVQVHDARIISNLIAARHGGETIAAIGIEDIDAHNVVTVIDGALDALINCFYLAKDGVDSESASYLAKHQQRAASAMSWIEGRAEAGELGTLGDGDAIDLVDIALGTTLAWMGFRHAYDVDQHPALARALERYAKRASFAATQPPG